MIVVRWLLWSPRRFYGTLATLAVIAVVLTVGGVARSVGSLHNLATTTAAAPALEAAPTGTMLQLLAVSPDEAAAIAAAVAYAGGYPGATPTIGTGDSSQVVVNVPAPGGGIPVVVTLVAGTWTAP